MYLDYTDLIVTIKEEIRNLTKEYKDGYMENEYLTTAGAREYLGGISVNTLTKFCRQGLKRVTIDGIRLYKKADIEEFLDRYRN